MENMKKILFHFGEQNLSRPFRMGEFIEALQASYFRAKEVGYEDVSIEWADIKYDVKKQNRVLIIN